jgi:hypothetical protein
MRFASTSLFLTIALPIAQSQPVGENALLPAPARQVIGVTPDPGAFNGPSIAINPANTRQLVVAFGSRVTAGYSTDSGEHWAISNGTAPTNYRATGDISVTFDSARPRNFVFHRLRRRRFVAILGPQSETQQHPDSPLAGWRKNLGASYHPRD